MTYSTELKMYSMDYGGARLFIFAQDLTEAISLYELRGAPVSEKFLVEEVSPSYLIHFTYSANEYYRGFIFDFREYCGELGIVEEKLVGKDKDYAVVLSADQLVTFFYDVKYDGIMVQRMKVAEPC